MPWAWALDVSGVECVEVRPPFTGLDGVAFDVVEAQEATSGWVLWDGWGLHVVRWLCRSCGCRAQPAKPSLRHVQGRPRQYALTPHMSIAIAHSTQVYSVAQENSSLQQTHKPVSPPGPKLQIPNQFVGPSLDRGLPSNILYRVFEMSIETAFVGMSLQGDERPHPLFAFAFVGLAHTFLTQTPGLEPFPTSLLELVPLPLHRKYSLVWSVLCFEVH
eukprot:850779-Amphidinium_carterae.3